MRVSKFFLPDDEIEQLGAIYRIGDRFMLWTFAVLATVCLVLALTGPEPVAMLLADGALAGIAWISFRWWGGTLRLRLLNAALLMAYSALMIQELHGMIEAHFGIFALLAFLVCYRDWRPLCVGAATIAAHHILFYELQRMHLAVFVFPCACGFGMVLVHALYVVVETGVLIYLAVLSRDEAVRMAGSLRSEQERVEQAPVAEESERLAQEQLIEVQKVARAFEVVSTGNQHIARSTDSAETKTKLALNEIEEGNVVLGETMERIQGISTGIMAATTQVEQLQMEMGSIRGVLDLIRSIASNTHMLSLNATIEAARAGAAGRGFGIVAAEIRRLAESTEQSTSKIERMVEGLMEQAEDARREITANSTTALAELHHLDEVRVKLRRLTECSIEIRETTQEIASSANGQCAETAKVTGPLAVLEGAAQRGTAHMRRLTETIASLNGLTRQDASLSRSAG
jgi:methyl-accepting chemotaxis protein